MINDSQELVGEISTSTKMNNDAIQPVEEISTSKEIDEWAVEIGARYNANISHATRPSTDINIEEKWPSIIGNWQCWNDFGVSFLPETLKWQFVAFMPHWFGLNVRLYLEYMQEKVDVAWSYYHGVDKQFRVENRKRFIEHLLVNSCFLIFVIVLSFGTEDDLKNVLLKTIHESNLPNGLTFGDITSIIQFLERDKLWTLSFMLTLENQIPWFVVEAIYTKFSNIGKLLDAPIHKLVLENIAKPVVVSNIHKYNEDGVIVPEGGFKHLLHIFHWSQTPEGMYMVDTLRPANYFGKFYIPCATELQLSQIVFVKDEGASHNVSYCDGTLSAMMQLTPCYINEFSTKLFPNLLKFERCYGCLCGYHFMAYVACISFLLKTEEDIKLLRTNGLINSSLIIDQDVLRLVQELRTFIPDDYRIPIELLILVEKVMAHYQRSRYRVYGEFKKRYCSNPWIIISVIAGILLFALTFIQTLYETLSYYKQ